MERTTHIRVMLRLLSGAVLVLPLNVLVVWRGTTVPFLYFPYDIVLTPGLSIPFGLLPSYLLIKIQYTILNLSHLCDILSLISLY
jgi:hypothetical protein